MSGGISAALDLLESLAACVKLEAIGVTGALARNIALETISKNDFLFALKIRLL